MKKLLVIACVLLVLAGMSVGLAGCSNSSNTGNGGDKGVEILTAPIHEVNVRVAESYPPKVIVYIRGGLSDGCTVFHEITTERAGNTISIEVTTSRPEDAICTQIYGFFEKDVNLGSDFTSGQTYTFKVNYVTVNYVMP